MRTLIAPLLAFIAAMLLSGCGPKDARYDPSHFRLRGVLAPPEVVLPKGTVPGAEVDGLYTQRPSDADKVLCCFISPHATLVVRKDRPAAHLRIEVYVLDAAVFQDHPQTLRIGFPRARTTTIVRGLTPGFHSLSVSVPRALQLVQGPVRVDVDAAIDYVPSTASTSADTRHLALLVTSIYFE
jgi:hypothetical protein